MRTQELYSKVRRHLLRQNARATIGNSCGQYLTDDGKKCAVGCLIKSKFYSEGFEGLGADEPLVCRAVQKSLGARLTARQKELLLGLQEIHDVMPVEKWRAELDWLAAEYGLKAE